VSTHPIRGRVTALAHEVLEQHPKGKAMNPIAQAWDWTGRLIDQNSRYFVGGAAVLVLTAVARTVSQDPSVPKGLRDFGQAAAAEAREVQRARYAGGTDLSVARPIHAAERALPGAVASVGSEVLDTLQRAQGTPGFELVDDNVLDPIVRHLSRSAIAEGQPGTRLTGILGMKKNGQLVIQTQDNVVHEIIGAQDRRGADDPDLLKVLSGLVGRNVTITGYLDPLDPLPAKDFVAWSFAPQSKTLGMIGAVPTGP
jgi:hypothetical protein